MLKHYLIHERNEEWGAFIGRELLTIHELTLSTKSSSIGKSMGRKKTKEGSCSCTVRSASDYGRALKRSMTPKLDWTQSTEEHK